MNALKGLVVASALWLAIPALGADASQTGAQKSSATSTSKLPEQEDLELEEVLVDGQRPSKDPDKITKWFIRLVGEFRVEGHVEVPGDTQAMQQVPVRGSASCHGIGGEHMDRHEAPGVECFLDVTWPQVREADAAIPWGSPTLRPAVMIYGYDGLVMGVKHLLVDNKGVAEGGVGRLFGDTVASSATCANIAGNCRRRVRITAEPDLKSVQMRIDMEVDGTKAGGYQFVLHREPASP